MSTPDTPPADKEAAAPTAAAPSAKLAPAKPATPKPASAKPAPARSAIAKEKTRTTPITNPASTANEEYFYLNVGLFADDNNARNAHVKLLDAGLPSTQQEIKTPKGLLTRVRVGPFDTLTQADVAARKIRALGLEAVLVRP